MADTNHRGHGRDQRDLKLAAMGRRIRDLEHQIAKATMRRRIRELERQLAEAREPSIIGEESAAVDYSETGKSQSDEFIDFYGDPIYDDYGDPPSVYEDVDPIYDVYGDGDENPQSENEEFTFADPEDADKVLEKEHVIDGWTVEVKRIVPREDTQQQQHVNKGVTKTKKIFVGGIQPSFTEDEMNIVEHQIMLDHPTERSRGFGFVTFETEGAVERVFVDGQRHELGGKLVEIKRAEPKRYKDGSSGSAQRSSYRGGSSFRSSGAGCSCEIRIGNARKKVRKHLLSWSELRSWIGDDEDADSRTNLFLEWENDAVQDRMAFLRRNC